MITEDYCEECNEIAECNRATTSKCLKHRAAVTCAATGCKVMILYPAGTKHPKYCKEHMADMMARMDRTNKSAGEDDYPELYR